jgi:bifunctional UDP-N-acetylglucosamine pyrophosphorylase/glucosamine-1-phosphate N-acetyltransferase
VSANRPAAVIVLAAGEGTRMKSATPKVLHQIAGRSLVGHAVAAARALDPARLLVVVGHGRDQVIAHLAELDSGAEPVVQADQLGTGHAVATALAHARASGSQLGDGASDGIVVVTFGDTPLLTSASLDALVAEHRRTGAVVTVLTARVPDPGGYGRVLRVDGEIVGSVEERDATPEQQAITEVVAGVFAFDAGFLAAALTRISADNAQGEYYLPDVLSIARADGQQVGALMLSDYTEMLGVNDRVQLANVRALLNHRLLTHWMRMGVTVVDPATTWVDVAVTLEPDVLLEPGVHLRGDTSVGAGATIGPDTTLVDSVVAERARVVRSHLVGASVGPDADVGPYAYLRPGASLGAAAKAGTFVEVKNATLGAGAKVPHLTYVGDADIGEGTNIGASSVFVNYDGVAKHRTTIGDHCRTGSDTMFVAPVRVGDGAYTAAGSVITNDIPPGAMGVARARQRNIEGWVIRKRPGTPAADAAARALAAAETAPPQPSDPPEPSGVTTDMDTSRVDEGIDS